MNKELRHSHSEECSNSDVKSYYLHEGVWVSSSLSRDVLKMICGDCITVMN